MGGGCKIDRSHARPGTPPIGWLAVFLGGSTGDQGERLR